MSTDRVVGPGDQVEPVDHVDKQQAAAIVRGSSAGEVVLQHLAENCGLCHARLIHALDGLLIELEAGPDVDDAVRTAFLRLGDVYLHRHLCPVDLIQRLMAGDPTAERHLRRCALCRADVAELDDISSSPETGS